MDGGQTLSYALLNTVTGCVYHLFEGRNIIGRSPCAVDDAAFINLESPRSAISRMHAVIVVAPNGDIWVTDAKSTNGTCIALREGVGVAVQPDHWYQATPGSRILFGDLELSLVVDDVSGNPGTGTPSDPVMAACVVGSSPTANVSQGGSLSAAKIRSYQAAAAAGIPEHFPRTLSDMPLSSVARARSGSLQRRGAGSGNSAASGAVSGSPQQLHPLSSSVDRAAAELLATKSTSLPAQQLVPVIACNAEAKAPYLEEKEVTTAINESAVAHQTNTAKGKVAQKRPRSESVATKQGGADDANTKGEPEANMIALPPDSITVVLSGFDTKEKDVLGRLLRARRGKTVDEITDRRAQLLVVKEPAPRTPKFLIAMGLGIPIVTCAFLEEQARLQQAPNYMPTLLHNGVKFTSKKLLTVSESVRSMKPEKCGVFDGLTFLLSDAVPAASRTVLTDVIKGCGGSILRRKKNPNGADDGELDAGVISVADPETIYHALLTGESLVPAK